jgi:hypothetical protein
MNFNNKLLPSPTTTIPLITLLVLLIISTLSSSSVTKAACVKTDFIGKWAFLLEGRELSTAAITTNIPNTNNHHHHHHKTKNYPRNHHNQLNIRNTKNKNNHHHSNNNNQQNYIDIHAIGYIEFLSLNSKLGGSYLHVRDDQYVDKKNIVGNWSFIPTTCQITYWTDYLQHGEARRYIAFLSRTGTAMTGMGTSATDNINFHLNKATTISSCTAVTLKGHYYYGSTLIIPEIGPLTFLGRDFYNAAGKQDIYEYVVFDYQGLGNTIEGTSKGNYTMSSDCYITFYQVGSTDKGVLGNDKSGFYLTITPGEIDGNWLIAAHD